MDPPDPMLDERVTVERDGGVAIVRLNRPDRLNALAEPMKEKMGSVFESLSRDPEVRAVLLCAAGRAFCASGDVTSMGAFTVDSAQDRLKRAHRMIINLARIDKPVIAAVQGPVVGIGWSMALACDTIIAADDAYFAQVFKNVGLTPDGGGVFFLAQNLGVLRAKALVLSGRKVPAEEALALGLVEQVVAAEALFDTALAHAHTLAAGPTLAFALGKRMFKHVDTPALETFLDAESWAQSVALLSEDHAEGARAFLEKRKPQFSGR
ncbi:enoyl-CoA hydratase/isomerase family protein [Schauerella aestuarii]|uniref:enoyl-CoA hydratase/isomerase family protein n=1 Tax=Schauerella aestuarii TaxID=2511204 RepID=UPI001925B95F|nr:enoyl-CoA hydratase-related protein [Achromobacter aestuarii]